MDHSHRPLRKPVEINIQMSVKDKRKATRQSYVRVFHTLHGTELVYLFSRAGLLLVCRDGVKMGMDDKEMGR